MHPYVAKPRGDALTCVPKQVERRCDRLGSVLDVRAMLLGEMRLQSGGDLVGCSQRRLHRIVCLSLATGASRSHLIVPLHVYSAPRRGHCKPVRKHAPDRRPQH
jgi:hypothetical protein